MTRARRRLGIVLTDFGLPSEVWSLRQAASFKNFDPVFFAATHAPGNLPVPEGHALSLFGDMAADLPRRIERKLGLASGALPPRRVLARMRKMLLDADLDAVLCHFGWNAIAVAKALDGALPVICHVHGRDVTAMLRHPAYRRALARALPHFARVVAVGRYQQDVLAELCPGLKTDLIPCGAPTALFAARALPERAPGEEIVFVSVGRVSPEKGQMQIVASFEELAPAHPDARLVLVGNGPQMAELRTRVAGSPVGERIRLTGMLPSDAVADELARAHVYLQHSRPEGGWMEGFPTTLVEAGAAGLPLIATRVGGTPDQVFDGRNGILIAPDDIAAQTRAMARLAGDETLRQEMGAAAREIAGLYDSATMAQKLEAVISGTTGVRA